MYNLLFTNGFEIFGLDVKFYGITMALGMLIGIIVAMYNSKLRNFKKDDIITVALYVLPLAVLGARLYYVIFSPNTYSFIEFFQIWKGGMAIYGGIIGGAIGCALFCLIHKKNVLNLFDLAAVSVILGQSIGRWGNFFNQEAYGYAVTNPNFQWFPYAVFIEGSGWHLATFFYEFLLNAIIFVVLMILIRKIKEKGVMMSLYFILYGMGRIFIEGLRMDSLYIGSTGIRVSQLLSGILVLFGIIFLIVIYTKSRKNKNELKEGNIPKSTNSN